MAVSPTFLKPQVHNDEIWDEGADVGVPPHAKFCKNRLRGYTPFGKFIPKIPILAILGLYGPHYLSNNGEILSNGADLGLPPPNQIL